MESIDTKCLICQDIDKTNYIPLSDGSFVHDKCFNELDIKVCNLSGDLHELNYDIESTENEIHNRGKVLRKLTSIFNPDEITTLQLKNELEKKNSAYIEMQDNYDEIKCELTQVYDLWMDYPGDWAERKSYLINERGTYCEKCGLLNFKLHVRHIKKLCNGGSNRFDNLQLLCRRCHLNLHRREKFYDGDNLQVQNLVSKRIIKINEAIDTGQDIKFDYKKRDEKNYKQRSIKPIKLINMEYRNGKGSTLCIKGICHLRNGERNFALHRMRALKLKRPK